MNRLHGQVSNYHSSGVPDTLSFPGKLPEAWDVGDSIVALRSSELTQLLEAARNCEDLLSELKDGGADNPELDQLQSALAPFRT